MPELSLTGDQHDRLEEVRADIEEAFVDTYGRTRMEDALEYLLDTYTPPDEHEADASAYNRIATAEYPELQRVASDIPGVPGSGIDADEMRGRLLVHLDPEEFAAKLETDDTAEPSADDGDKRDDDDAADSDESDTGSGGGGGGLLSTANRLLDEHDDKWRESDGEAPYEVDLPDGSTESARTKDDVRQHLFRHY